MKDDLPVYWDNEKKRMYWIAWEDTGNGDIPHRRYIAKDESKTKPTGAKQSRNYDNAICNRCGRPYKDCPAPEHCNNEAESPKYQVQNKYQHKAKPRAEQYADQLVYVVECMLNASPGGCPNTHFGLARAQAETLIAKIKGD